MGLAQVILRTDWFSGSGWMITAKGMKEIPILLHIGWTLDGGVGGQMVGHKFARNHEISKIEDETVDIYIIYIYILYYIFNDMFYVCLFSV